ncbi:hypothetical protein [uncultured Dokdonia sp.]|uniref:hypothetical protein n=1 Tax=uncultured Dokdonia sp. TaxID=575653 RepID=UPI00260EAAC3|nr:hypothetical protein [uncultured Dokdonia sp.]
MGLHKILKIVVGVIGIIAMVIAGIVWTIDSEPLQEEVKALGINNVDVPSSIGNLMTIGYIVLALILVLVVIFVIKGLFSGNAKNVLIGVGIFLLVIAISYFTASDVIPDDIMKAAVKQEIDLTPNMMKWVGAGINSFFILAATAIGLMVLSGAKKLVK